MIDDKPTQKPDPLRERLGRVLEGALNRALDLDVETRQRLSMLEGRRIGVQLRGTNVALAIRVDDERLRVGPHWEATPELNLRAAPGGLISMLMRRDEDDTPVGQVEISGDAELARRVQKLAAGFSPDFEEAFARAFGDVLGVPIARAFRRALGWSRATAKAFAQNTAEYLRDESRDLIAPTEMDEFLDDVDTLRERAERFEARLKNLIARAGGARA